MNELRRLESAGEVTPAERERVERAEREAYRAWRLARTGPLGRHTKTPDEAIEAVPRDH